MKKQAAALIPPALAAIIFAISMGALLRVKVPLRKNGRQTTVFPILVAARTSRQQSHEPTVTAHLPRLSPPACCFRGGGAAL